MLNILKFKKVNGDRNIETVKSKAPIKFSKRMAGFSWIIDK